jgi:hypothetical protein
MKNVVIDFDKTLGELMYLGCEPYYKYEDNKRTDKIAGFSYKLASSVQGDAVTVKVEGDQRELAFMQKVELVNPTVKIYGTASKSGFVTINYAISAEDIKNG